MSCGSMADTEPRVPILSAQDASTSTDSFGATIVSARMVAADPGLSGTERVAAVRYRADGLLLTRGDTNVDSPLASGQGQFVEIAVTDVEAPGFLSAPVEAPTDYISLTSNVGDFSRGTCQDAPVPLPTIDIDSSATPVA